RAVEFVGQHEVGYDRSALGVEVLAATLDYVDDVGVEDVGRHQVGGEVDAGEVGVDALGQGAHQHRLAETGHALEQRVAAAQDGGDDALDDLVLADDQRRDLVLESPQVGAERGHRRLHVAVALRRRSLEYALIHLGSCPYISWGLIFWKYFFT